MTILGCICPVYSQTACKIAIKSKAIPFGDDQISNVRDFLGCNNTVQRFPARLSVELWSSMVNKRHYTNMRVNCIEMLSTD